MLKFSVFSLGLGTGLMLGIYLRQQGMTSKLTKAYHTYKREDYGNTDSNKIQKSKPNVDDLHEYVNKGLLTGDKFKKAKEMILNKRYNDIDKVVVEDVNQMMNEPSMKTAREEYNAFYRDKKK